MNYAIRAKYWPAKDLNPPIFPRGRALAIAFSIVLPNAATLEDVCEWLALHMGDGSMKLDNPLGHFEPEAFREITVEDRGIETNYHDVMKDLAIAEAEHVMAAS